MLNQFPLLNVVLKHVSLKLHRSACLRCVCGACKVAVQGCSVDAATAGRKWHMQGAKVRWITFVGRPYLSMRMLPYRQLIFLEIVE